MTQTFPSVKIIVPTFGRPDKLADSLKSLKMQTYPNIEILMVDDNNPDTSARDETVKLMESFVGDSNVHYILRGKNGGGSLARNDGVSRANGEYMTFLDDDDVYQTGKVEKQFKHLMEEQLDVSVCDMHFMEDGKNKNVSACLARVGNLADFITQGNAFTPMIMSKKSCLKSVGGFHEPKFQDHLLMIKLLRAGFRIGILRVPLFTHNNHRDEHITLTERFCEGYKQKIRSELQNESVLNKKQAAVVAFRRNMVLSRISAHEIGFLTAMKYWLMALPHISNFQQCRMIF